MVTSLSAGTGLDPAPLTLQAVREYLKLGAFQPGPLGRVGLEVEAHLFDLLEPERRPSWELIQELLGRLPLLPGGSAITLEPGGQLELSGPPAAALDQALLRLHQDRAVVQRQARGLGLGLLSIGADPLRAIARVNPKLRYQAMERHWQASGQSSGSAMMNATAAIQINVEAGPAPGWPQRWAWAEELGPLFVAITASSPWLAGRPTGWRSTRQRVWHSLDPARCGAVRGGPDPAERWVNYVLAAPVMMIDNTALGHRVPWGSWLSGAVRLANRMPTLADLDLHLTTLFPPVRPRGFLELRYLDAVPEYWLPAVATSLVTLLDHPEAICELAATIRPLRGAWLLAARTGLADAELAQIAGKCLLVAERLAAGPAVQQIGELAELVRRGRGPAEEWHRAADLSTIRELVQARSHG